MENKGSDTIGVFIGGCLSIVVLFILFTLVMSVIL